MSLSIIDPDGLLDNLQRRFVERRFQFALSRFDSRIAKANVIISSLPKQGDAVQMECEVHVTMRRAADVSVRERDADWKMCVSRAAERTGRRVARSIDRHRDPNLVQKTHL